jgi:hypothetical protein
MWGVGVGVLLGVVAVSSCFFIISFSFFFFFFSFTWFHSKLDSGDAFANARAFFQRQVSHVKNKNKKQQQHGAPGVSQV